MRLAVFLQLRLADSNVVTRLHAAFEHLVGPVVDSDVSLQVGFNSDSVVAEVAFKRFLTYKGNILNIKSKQNSVSILHLCEF